MKACKESLPTVSLLAAQAECASAAGGPQWLHPTPVTNLDVGHPLSQLDHYTSTFMARRPHVANAHLWQCNVVHHVVNIREANAGDVHS